MFRSLLRTLPSLSGNVTLTCKIDECTKLTQDTFETYIRNAAIMPLQNKYYSKKLDINMYRGKWESDVARYFVYYSDNFFENNFPFLKDDYTFVDLNTNMDARNKDYEFGCKRISYAKTGYQFQFYAPIYIDNANQFPEYFELSIQLSPSIIKKIKIYIGKENSKNYILHYLKNYVSLIDENVLHINPYNFNCTYYGIDTKNGGFVKYNSNINHKMSEFLFTGEFDRLLNDGFKNGHIIMKQILPLSFVFNINDILTPAEQKYLEYNECTITGKYFNKYDQPYKFYDFDIDYTNTQIYVYKYNYSTYQKQLLKSNNIYGSSNYDSLYNYFLHENNNSFNKLNNKVTPMYSKWKLLTSTDDNPYIINNSPLFTLQNPKYYNLTYHGFPANIDEINPLCIINGGNLILPSNKTNYVLYNNVPENLTKYILTLENTHNLFNIIRDDVEELSEYDFKNESNWSDMHNLSTLYHDILFNFEYETSVNNLTDIDKFGVFMRLHINKFSLNTTDESYNAIVTSKYNIETNSSNVNNIYVYDGDQAKDNYEENTIYSLNPNFNVINDTYENNAFMYYNESYIKDTFNGNYVMNDTLKNSNEYIILNDVININSQDDTEICIYDLTDISDIGTIYSFSKIMISPSDIISGYVYFKLTQQDILHIAQSYKTNTPFTFKGSDGIYVSNVSSPNKINLSTIYNEVIENISNNIKQYNLYIKYKYMMNALLFDSKYINNQNVIGLMNNTLPSITISEESKNHIKTRYHNLKYKLDKCIKFEYVADYNENGDLISNFFKDKSLNLYHLYVDCVNLQTLALAKGKKHLLDNMKPFYALVKVTNKDQITTYVKHICATYQNIYNDESCLPKFKELPIEDFVGGFVTLSQKSNIDDDTINDKPKPYYTWYVESDNKTEMRFDPSYEDATYYIEYMYDPYTVAYWKKPSELINDIYNSLAEHNVYAIHKVYPYTDNIREIVGDDKTFNAFFLYKSVHELINVNDKIEPDSISPEYENLLNVILYKYSKHITQITNEIDNIRQRMKSSHRTINKQLMQRLYDLDQQLQLYENLKQQSALPIVICDEAIENNYENTPLNVSSLQNYLLTAKPTTYNYSKTYNKKSIDNSNDDYTIDISPVTVDGTEFTQFNNDYAIYVENWKNYTGAYDDESINSWLKKSNLMHFIINTLYEYITTNINYKRNIYKIVNQSVLDIWFKNENGFDKFTEEYNTQEPHADENTIRVEYNVLNDLLYRNPVLSIITFNKIISALNIQNEDNTINIKKYIYDDLKNICRILVLHECGQDANSDLVHYEYCVNTYNHLLNILGIIIYKKYNGNNIVNNSYHYTEYNGKKYLYIMFDYYVDNWKYSYNILSNNINSYFIDKINGEEFSYDSFVKNIDYIIPIYKANMINTFLNVYKNVINTLTQSHINNNISLSTEKSSNIVNLYDSIGFGNPSTIYSASKMKNVVFNKYSISRYFNDVTPLFIEIDDYIKNVFQLKFKGETTNINSDILYKNDINIYKYSPLRVYRYQNNNLTYDEVNQYEYKHFNDNKLYNLEEEFRITDHTLYTYDELISNETYEITFNKFKNHVYDKIKYTVRDLFDENILLFLYNKYKVSYESNCIKSDSSNSIKLYKLTYVYKLI